MTVTVSSYAGFDASASYVQIGSTRCSKQTLLSSTATSGSWTCIIPPLGAATYSVRALAWPHGYAVLSTGQYPTFVSLFAANKMRSVVSSSVGGGATLSLSGFGFSNVTNVTICGQACLGTSSYYSFNCSIPALTTADSVEHFEAMNITRDLIATLNGSVFSSADARTGSKVQANKAVDQNYETFFQDNHVGCYIGIQLPVGYVSRPFRMRFYPRVQFSNYFHGAVFEASADRGQTFHVLASIDVAHEGWNFVDPAANQSHGWYDTFRYRSTDPMTKTSYCYLAEVEFLGVLAYLNATCSVRAAQATFVTNVGTVSYDHYSYTPVVTSLDPSNGTSLGGTTLNIAGMNFLSTTGEAPTVSISGIPCKVTHHTATTIQCITRARNPDQVLPSYLDVFVPHYGHSISSDSAVYLYIDRWSALTTWLNQEPPVAGDLVWVPEGQVIMLDVNTPVLSALLIEGSLYFDTERDVTLDAYYIFVKGGIMQVGTHEHPYERNATITLHGDRYCEYHCLAR